MTNSHSKWTSSNFQQEYDITLIIDHTGSLSLHRNWHITVQDSMAQQPEVHKLLGFPIHHLSSDGAQIHSFLPLNISGYAFAPQICVHVYVGNKTISKSLVLFCLFHYSRSSIPLDS